MKKILIALLAVSMLFVFTACDDDSSEERFNLASAENVNAEMVEFRDAFVKVHNKIANDNGGSSDYVGSDKVTETVSSIGDMYIELGEVGNVESVGLLGKTYKSGDEIMPVSIGMNVFYKDAAWQVEDGHLLVNKAAFLFSLLTDNPLKVNGSTYDDYSVFDGEPVSLTVSEVNYGDAPVTAENGVYEVNCTDSTTLLRYSYTNASETDLLYVVTSENGEITQNSILTYSAADFGSYLLPYGKDITENVDKTLGKEYLVLSNDGSSVAVKGAFDITVHVTATAEEV